LRLLPNQKLIHCYPYRMICSVITPPVADVVRFIQGLPQPFPWKSQRSQLHDELAGTATVKNMAMEDQLITAACVCHYRMV
jgi:hypothetical protein